MDSAPDHNLILLIRTPPGGPDDAFGAPPVAAALGPVGAEAVVFFHGPGVEHAFGEARAAWAPLADSGARLEVCSAAWQRRHDGALEPPFMLSTLVRFWNRLARGYRVVDLQGESGAVRGDAFWLVVVSAEPAEPDGREMLELVLAGASLELPLAVLFQGAGCRHLVGETARGWRQLVDYEMAALYCAVGQELEAEVPVTRLDSEGLKRLRAASRGEIRL
jgi:hypothetical protein